MSIETLAHQGREHVHSGLAGIDGGKLRKLRSSQLQECFLHMDEVQYRREYVATIRNVDFVNDAASRNVNATWYTLERIEGPVVWIAMGSESPVDYAKLSDVVRRKVQGLICVGGSSAKLHEAFDTEASQVTDAASLADAVHKAFYHYEGIKKIVFSPACDNGIPTVQLGAHFVRCVNEI